MIEYEVALPNGIEIPCRDVCLDQDFIKVYDSYKQKAVYGEMLGFLSYHDMGIEVTVGERRLFTGSHTPILTDTGWAAFHTYRNADVGKLFGLRCATIDGIPVEVSPLRQPLRIYAPLVSVHSAFYTRGFILAHGGHDGN